MPNYPGSNQGALLFENTQAQPWLNELVAPGALSLSYQLRRDFRKGATTGLSVEVAFSAAPGTFEIDVMGADADILTHYVALAPPLNAVNNFFVGRIDVLNVYAKYVALFMKTSPNAGTVLVTAQITR